MKVFRENKSPPPAGCWRGCGERNDCAAKGQRALAETGEDGVRRLRTDVRGDEHHRRGLVLDHDTVSCEL